MELIEQEILDEISAYFIQYLKSGKIVSFLRKLNPNFNINNIQKLFRIHFVLTKKGETSNKFGVIDFINSLEKNIRRLKTITSSKEEILQAEVRGKINWNRTIKRKFTLPEKEFEFICTKKERKYDVIENIVLKLLLKEIYDIINNDLDFAFENKYDWLKDWIRDPNLKRTLIKIYLKNIYINKINLKNIIINERKINRVKNSRFSIYRHSAELLWRLRNLNSLNFDKNEATEILKNTLINPYNISVLFELYWIIKIIDCFNASNINYELIKPGENLIASWTLNNNQFEIYHDSNVNFLYKEQINNIFNTYKEKNDYIGRYVHILKKYDELLDKRGYIFRNKRPDIVLIKYNQNNGSEKNITSILIGEVKYSEEISYLENGLKELLEYVAYAKMKNNNTYLMGIKNLFKNHGFDKNEIKIQGILFTKNIKNFNLKTDESIKLIKYGEIEKLRKVIKNFSN